MARDPEGDGEEPHLGRNGVEQLWPIMQGLVTLVALLTQQEDLSLATQVFLLAGQVCVDMYKTYTRDRSAR
jgi:hypothetical protein